MDFTFTEEQQLLRNSLSSFLADRYSFEHRKTTSNSATGWDRSVWQAFADELGILAMPFPCSAGGMGCDSVNTLVVMEELGRALVLEPYLESVVLCGELLKGLGGPCTDTLLGQVGAGEQVLALAWAETDSRYNASRISTRARRVGQEWRLDGAKSVVMAAPWADTLLVTARTSGDAGDKRGISVFRVEADRPGVEPGVFPTVDGRRAADVRLREVVLPHDALLGDEGGAWEHIEYALDAAVAALCAEALGVMHRLHADTLAYTRQREQFGQPISRFQVLQHRMVDMYIEYEMATSATYLATLKLMDGPSERARAVSSAKVTVGEACRFIGQNAVQLHGGMGMTDELAVSHYFRRATVIEGELGSVDYHLGRYAQLGE